MAIIALGGLLLLGFLLACVAFPVAVTALVWLVPPWREARIPSLGGWAGAWTATALCAACVGTVVHIMHGTRADEGVLGDWISVQTMLAVVVGTPASSVVGYVAGVVVVLRRRRNPVAPVPSGPGPGYA